MGRAFLKSYMGVCLESAVITLACIVFSAFVASDTVTLRRRYLMAHRRVQYTNLKTSGRLTAHLAEAEQAARQMIAQIVTQTAKAENVTEALKEADPLRWAGLMNAIRHSAEETVLRELIYH